jgi:hypothetical protein
MLLGITKGMKKKPKIKLRKYNSSYYIAPLKYQILSSTSINPEAV